ncbi:MAG TPA: sigma-70 family RNA polymerase sigma factor [Polyangiaceae bacterium]|jgi:RNA polymerase sigma factor for flagellar operon FliA|nr:sigma-70 family RNA polymerase sigma factor [Polyangiaceae bacterium]
MAEQTTVREVAGTEVAEFMPLVHHVVGTMLPRLPPNVLRDDLVAAGTFGLLDALRRQAPTERGAEFGWYARVRIRGAILDELRSQDWLSRRARRRFASEERTSGAAVVGIEDLPEERRGFADEGAMTPELLVSARSDAKALAKAVEQLPVRERNIITQHYFDGVQLRAIAKDLGVSEPRVSQLHARAVARLKEMLAA